MKKEEAAALLTTIDFGSGVAETDSLLESARIETSVFADLLADRVDLVPGTKGSGKTALYRIFVDFLPNMLLKKRRVVIAHGVRQREDTVFLAHKEKFEALTEEEFVDFWCIYIISLAYEQFVRSERFRDHLQSCGDEIAIFRTKYRGARIPEFDRSKSLTEIVEWTLAVVKYFRPKISWKPEGNMGQFEFSLDTEPPARRANERNETALMPRHIDELTTSLEAMLAKADLSLWLMIDRLDELFARRSKTEQRALRGLLRTLRLFDSDRIRVKVFLRDDILEQIVSPDGFTALSHVTARKSDTLRWSEEQILAMIVRRIFVSKPLARKFRVDHNRLISSMQYQAQLFYHSLRTPCTGHRIKARLYAGFTTIPKTVAGSLHPEM